MMRALWTAGLGMNAQQMNVDVISNNLANVNTTSYKTERAEFKDLLYETMQRASLMNGSGKPVNLQVGLGTTVSDTERDFSPGNMENTGNPLDFAINGEGFFTVQGPKGDTEYTKDGSFKISVTDGGNMLTTSDGYPVLDDTGNPIVFTINPNDLQVNENGELGYMDPTAKTYVSLGQNLGIVQFPNKEGLLNEGGNLYSATSASGDPVADSEQDDKSLVMQKFLESSNVQIVNEMVKLIVAQRAYETNSKAVQSADEMLGMANNLRR
ncbi:MAG: flagellar basal-body rod protein FlgG [Bacillota bacterium]|nr:flagellar basal-body rod protein FlgG [Bacillota bacterium]